MTRFTESRERSSGQTDHSQRLADSEFPIQADPLHEKGAFRVTADGQIYYSNGLEWIVPSIEEDIARPTALVPTTAEEQTQLRLTDFRSPAGLLQGGGLFEISVNGINFDGAETRTVNGEFVNIYQMLFPEDGFEPGDEIYWRAKYFGTEGAQSPFSIPFRQTYPEFITDPSSLTREGAVTGFLDLTPFDSPFDLNYVDTQVEIYELDGQTLFDSFTSIVGASTPVSGTVPEGASYIWRARYGGRVGLSGPILYTEWTEKRSFLNGARSMVLVYDPALALNRTINLPLGVYGGVVNVTVEWGDGSSNTYTTSGVKSKTYAPGVTGLVTVSISGQLGQYGGNTNIQGLVRVDNIGFQLGLNSLREMFRNLTSNTTACTSDLPPQVKSIQGIFLDADSIEFDVTGFNVDSVENFSLCFQDVATFNQNIGGWNTSAATNMDQMFRKAVLFNNGGSPSINGWDVSSVTTMLQTFCAAEVFNQPLDQWDVSSVTNMHSMFGCFGRSDVMIFNQNIGTWDVSSVTNMHRMFASIVDSGAGGRNEFNNGGVNSLKNWDVSNVQDFSFMFGFGSGQGTLFNHPLTGWNLSSATNVEFMFRGAQFNNDVTGWVLPTSISGLMAQAGEFNHISITDWDTSNVTNMSRLFEDAHAFNQPIGVWDVSNVTNMGKMFYSPGRLGVSYSFNQPLNGWNVSNVTDMSFMFSAGLSPNGTYLAHLFDQPLNNWDVSNVTTMEGMFSSSSHPGSRHYTEFDRDISMWEIRVEGVNLTDMLFGIGNLFSTENYSKLLAGWSNSITERNGPFGVLAGFGDRSYNDTDYFVGELHEDAVAARAYLTNSNRLTVSDAGDADADGNYLFDGTVQLYVSANDWYFIKIGGVWELRDNLDAVQATQQDAGNLAAPQLVETWNGDLANATVLRTGAAWTITDGGLAT